MQGTSRDLGQAQAHVARAQAAGMQALAQAQQLGLQVEQAGGTGLAHDGGGHDGDRGLAQGRGWGSSATWKPRSQSASRRQFNPPFWLCTPV